MSLQPEGRPQQEAQDGAIVAVHASEHDTEPLGTGFLVDGTRVLTSAHTVHVDGMPLAELWVAFPRSAALMGGRVRVREIIAPPRERQQTEDVAVLKLARDVGARFAARLRLPEPGELIGQEWSSYGFAHGDFLGNPASGTVTSSLAYGWVQLDLPAGRGNAVAEGYSGAPLWSADYQAVVGIVGLANYSNAVRALTLWQVDRILPQAKLRTLADWTAEAAGESALAAWGWSLAEDPEAGRHWKPRARGVARDSERGFRFRGRRSALTALAAWISSEEPQRSALVVTGSPGVGKSAVLGRIVTSADPDIARVLPPGDDAVRAPLGSVACAVHAKSKNALDVAREIACAASARLPRQTGDLVLSLSEALAKRPGRLFAVVIDALDEAATPKDARDMVRWIVRPLVEDLADLGVRVVVGSRRRDDDGDLLGVFRPAITVIDLDDPAYFELEDLEAYSLASLQLLGAEKPGNPYEDAAVAGPVAARIAALAKGNFLVAGLIARAHGIHDSTPVRPEDISFSPKVDGALKEFLERIPPLGRRSAAELLTVLAYAEAPGFTAGIWHAAVNAVYGESPGEEQLRLFARSSAANFLVEDSAGDGKAEHERAYRLFHQALNDVLLAARDEAAADDHALTLAFINLGETVGWRRAPKYLLRSLPAHAQRGNAMAELMAQDDYPLYADLRRLIRRAWLGNSDRTQDTARLRLLRKAVPAIDASPEIRAAMFSVVEAQERLGSTYRDVATRSPYRAAWARTELQEEQAVLTGHAGTVFQVAALPTVANRVLLASSGADGTVRLWDPGIGENLRIIEIGDWPVTSICAVPSPGRTPILASSGRGGEVLLWDPDTGRRLRGMSTNGYRGIIDKLVAVPAPGGRHLLAAVIGDKSVRLWDPETGSVVQTLRRGSEPLSICAMRTGIEQQSLAIGFKDGSVSSWDPETGSLSRLVQGYTGAATAMCALPMRDGRTLLAVASSDGTVRLWDAVRGDHLRTLEQGDARVSAMCPVQLTDGRTLLVVSNGSGTLQAWDPDDVLGQHRLTASAGRVVSICPVRTSDGSTLLATSSDDGTVRLWELQPQAAGLRSEDRLGRQIALRAQPGRKGSVKLYSADENGAVNLWDANTGEHLLSRHTRTAVERTACLITRPRGLPLLATTENSEHLKLSDVESGRTLWTFRSRAKAFTRGPTINGMCVIDSALEDVGLLVTRGDGSLEGHDLGNGSVRRRFTNFGFLPREDGSPEERQRAAAEVLFARDEVGERNEPRHLTGTALRAVCSLRGPNREPLIAAVSGERSVLIWRVADRALVHNFELTANVNGEDAFLFQVPLPDGTTMLGGGTPDELVWLWDLNTQAYTCAVHRSGPWLTTACTLVGTSGRTLLATGGGDRVARIWGLEGRPVMDIHVRHEIVAMASAGNRLLLGFNDGVMAVDIDDTAV